MIGTRWQAWRRSKAAARLQKVRDRKEGRLISEWLERSHLQGSISCEQDRRLLAEEWAVRRSILFDQPHLIMALQLKPHVSIETIRQRLLHLIAQERILRSAFRNVASVDEEHRNHILRCVRQTGVIVGGMYYSYTVRRADLCIEESSIETDDPSPFAAATYERIRAAALKPFQVDQAPLLRATVFTNQVGCRHLVLIADRLILDWWSLGALQSKLRSACGEAAEPPSDRVHDEVRGSTRHDESALKALRYWQTKWTNVLPLTSRDFPFTLPECSLKGSFDSVAMTIPEALVDGLRSCSSKYGGLDKVLSSAVVLALHNASQRNTISVWSEFRTVCLQGSASSMGSFSNPHMVTVDLAETETAASAIAALTNAVHVTTSHGQVPLDLVWASMKWSPLRAMGYSIHISIQHHTLTADRDERDIAVSAWPLFETDRRFSLQLRSYENEACMGLIATYDSGKFDRAAINNVVADALSILNDVVRPDLQPKPKRHKLRHVTESAVAAF